MTVSSVCVSGGLAYASLGIRDPKKGAVCHMVYLNTERILANGEVQEFLDQECTGKGWRG